MSRENVRVVLTLVEAFNRVDLPAVLECIDPGGVVPDARKLSKRRG
jgi:hypothetical protein